MALVCSIPTSTSNNYAFIDCSTISISYAITGIATVSFTVVSTSSSITLDNYNEVTFGSNASSRSTGTFSAGSVKYTGFITSYEVAPITGTLVYEHKIQLTAWGCRV